MELSTQFKGAITELLVAAHLMSLGYNVSQPLTQDSKYDLIVDVHGKLLRLQVKTSRLNPDTKGKSIKFNCRSTTNNVRECKNRYYSSEEIDFFATYWEGLVFLIPVSQCSAEKILWIDTPTHSNSCYAMDYLAKDILENI